MVGYASDNTNSMVGKRNSVLSRLREKQPKITDLGCICHLENLCVVDACKKLVIPVDELLIDVFYHFHNRYNLYETGCILVIKIIMVVD